MKALAFACLWLIAWPAAAEDAAAAAKAVPQTEEFKLRFGGELQTDVRFRLAPKSIGPFYDRSDSTFYTRDDLPAGVARNQNLLKLKLDAVYGQFAGVVDLDLVYLGVPGEIDGVAALSARDQIDPYYFRAHAAYIEASDLLPGLDLRVGQQLVQWGKADHFNPTNNLNANDLEDVLLFGAELSNMMARLDYSPHSSLEFSAVLVPIFKPALLPTTAQLGLGATDRMPMAEAALRRRLVTEKAMTAGLGFPTTVSGVVPLQPDTSAANMQFALRAAYTLFGQDLALSYYRGRNDFPQPVQNHTSQLTEKFCDRAAPTTCVDGLLETRVKLAYPEVQVAGFNLAGEIPIDWIADSLGGIGYRIEVGVYFPEPIGIALLQDTIRIGIATQPAGEYDYDNDGQPGGPLPTVLDDTPFAKWTLGLDYTFGAHVMVNLMWVHGIVDEFGAGDFFSERMVVRRSEAVGDPARIQACITAERIGFPNADSPCGEHFAREVVRPRLGDYAVLGMDVRFLDDRALLRLFGILEVSPYFEEFYDEQAGRRVRRYLDLFGDGFSAILYPEFNYNFGQGLELGFGALLQFGESYTKFGDPAAGGHFVWTRARFSY